MFKVIAHRGASSDAPDNSAEAFTLALAQRADMIETDVRLSADGVLVLEHDHELAGLEVRYSTLAKLREVKPQLLTVAAAVRDFGANIPFCFECKEANIEHALVYLLKDLLPDAMWRRTEFTSFHLASAHIFGKLLKQLGSPNQVGWLTRQWDEAAIETVKEAGLAQICPPAHAVLTQPELVHYARRMGLNVRVWLIETPECVPTLAAAGVYGGTVNAPKAAREALESGLRP